MIRESSDANSQRSGATEIECGKDETRRTLSEMRKKGSTLSMTNDDGLSESNLSFPIKSTLFLNPGTFMHSLVVLDAFTRNWITRFPVREKEFTFWSLFTALSADTNPVHVKYLHNSFKSSKNLYESHFTAYIKFRHLSTSIKMCNFLLSSTFLSFELPL